MSTGQLIELKEGRLCQDKELKKSPIRDEPETGQVVTPILPAALDGPVNARSEVNEGSMLRVSPDLMSEHDVVADNDDALMISIGSQDEIRQPYVNAKVDRLPRSPAEAHEELHEAADDLVEIVSSLGSKSIDDIGSVGDDDDLHDAMEVYADSGSIPRANSQQRLSSKSERKLGALILADLSQDDRNAQIRYFQFSRDPSEAHHDVPIRCLVCAKEGHEAIECEELTCVQCGTYNDHPTADCPTTVKCGKCRETGHSQSSCPYKLKRMSRYEMTCDLCQRNGHAEDDCELFWRTSGRPWESHLPKSSLRIFCYECGRSGHLGNDCTARRPGKALGTSTWSLRKAKPIQSSPGEISIRGRALRSPNYSSNTDDEDGRDKFRRPKAAVPVQKGQIHINVANNRNVESFHHSHFPVNQPDPLDGQHRPRYEDPRNEAREANSNYQIDYKGGSRSYQPNERRPRNHNGQTDYNAVIDQKNPPQRFGPRKLASTYKPMPSAAHNAWAKHRT